MPRFTTDFITRSTTLLAAAFLSIALANPANAADVAGVHFDDKTSVAGSELQLNGAGLRKKFVFKVYAMGLYLPQKANTPAAVLASKGPRRIRIVTLRELSAEQLAEALVEGLHKNLSAAELEKLGSRVDSFRNTMLSIGKSPEKTQIQLDYLPASGTRLTVGGEQKGADIPGDDFYNALLRIWLGADPAQEDLRDALLGKDA